MPPKVDVNDPENARLLKLFESLNLSGNRAIETLTNPKHTAALESVITDNQLASKSIDPKASALIVSASTGKDASNKCSRDYVVSRILDGSLASSDQLNAAYKFLANTTGQPDKAAFDAECGVGKLSHPRHVAAAVLQDEIQKTKTHVLEPMGDSSPHGMQFLFFLTTYRYCSMSALILSKRSSMLTLFVQRISAFRQQASS
jgi:glutaminyl-tRNA synthetase